MNDEVKGGGIIEDLSKGSLVGREEVLRVDLLLKQQVCLVIRLVVEGVNKELVEIDHIAVQ